MNRFRLVFFFTLSPANYRVFSQFPLNCSAIVNRVNNWKLSSKPHKLWRANCGRVVGCRKRGFLPLQMARWHHSWKTRRRKYFPAVVSWPAQYRAPKQRRGRPATKGNDSTSESALKFGTFGDHKKSAEVEKCQRGIYARPSFVYISIDFII